MTYKIVFLSHSAMGGPFMVGSHHLSRGLAAMGHLVAHVSVPVTPMHLVHWRSAFERQRLLRWWRGGSTIEGVRDLIPASLLTWGAARQFGRPHLVYGAAFTPSLRRQLREADFLSADIVFIDEPRLASALDVVSANRVVYRPTDVYPKIRRDSTILDAERAVVARAHAFIATSQPVADHLRSLGVMQAPVIENGVDLAHFEHGPDNDVEDRLPPRPRAVYAGAFDRRFGVDELRAAALRSPRVSFVMIGPCPENVRRAASGNANIHFLGAIAYSSLPSYLRRCQVGLLPLAPDPANEGRSPMKLFEYAAVGLPVVASATPELERRGLGFVTLAATPAAFAEAVARVAGESESRRQDPRIEARPHGWPEKCAQALRLATEAPATDAPRPYMKHAM